MKYFDEIKENHCLLRTLLTGKILKITDDHEVRFGKFIQIEFDDNKTIFVMRFELLDEKYKKYGKRVVSVLPLLGVRYQEIDNSAGLIIKQKGSYYGMIIILSIFCLTENFSFL